MNIQESVFNAVETMTGLKANAINVYVQGVKLKEAAPAVLTDGKKND